eukprot:TRINITY_DN65815_c0_g1_i1.p2 TRINITY_DN65815_c0_g1~~TRINITY_DN65815_c0_g1_i1.p2  ORF type:complete len:196 (-),score=14.00 TRINITY_DN65815_c0_g1_i1:935-1522(-)
MPMVVPRFIFKATMPANSIRQCTMDTTLILNLSTLKAVQAPPMTIPRPTLPNPMTTNPEPNNPMQLVTVTPNLLLCVPEVHTPVTLPFPANKDNKVLYPMTITKPHQSPFTTHVPIIKPHQGHMGTLLLEVPVNQKLHMCTLWFIKTRAVATLRHHLVGLPKPHHSCMVTMNKPHPGGMLTNSSINKSSQCHTIM